MLSNQRRIQLIEKVKNKFLSFWGYATLSGRTKMLGNKVRQAIDDLADQGYIIKRQSISLQVEHLLEASLGWFIRVARLNKVPLFDPENPWKILFNSVIVTYNCLFLYVMSLEVFFEAHEKFFLTIGIIAQIAWVTEMIIQMNTCLYHDNRYITDRKEIMLVYFEEYLFFEILPLIFEGRSSSNVLFNILLHLPLLLKIKGMYIILCKLEFYVLQILKDHYFLQLFKLIMILFLLSHIQACFYNIVGELEMHILHLEPNWITQSAIAQNSHWYSRYSASVFWSFSILMNTSTVPQTEIEIMFTCLCMLVSCVFYGYTLNLIGSILNDIEKKKKEYKRDLNILNQFMNRKNITLALRRKANISLQDFYIHNREKLEQEEQVVKKIHPLVLKDIAIQSNSRMIKNFKILQNNFSQKTIEKICMNLEEVTYAPRQIIFDKNSDRFNCENIYFIEKGKGQIYNHKLNLIFIYYKVSLFVECSAAQASQDEKMNKNNDNTYIIKNSEEQLYQLKNKSEDQTNVRIKKNKKVVKVLEPGDAFGEFGFFTGQETICHAQSLEFTAVMRISRSKFLDLITDTPSEYERFCEIRDKIMYQKIDKDMLFSCNICESKDHYAMDCDKVFVNKQSRYFLYKQNFSISHFRDSSYIRRGKKSKNSLFTYLKCENVAQQIQDSEELANLLKRFIPETLSSEVSYASIPEQDSEEYIRSSEESLYNESQSRSFHRKSIISLYQHDEISSEKRVDTDNSGSPGIQQVQNYPKQSSKVLDSPEIRKMRPSVLFQPHKKTLLFSQVQYLCKSQKGHEEKIRHENGVNIDPKRINSDLQMQKMQTSNSKTRMHSSGPKGTHLFEQINLREGDEQLHRIQDYLSLCHDNQSDQPQTDEEKGKHDLIIMNYKYIKSIQDKFKQFQKQIFNSIHLRSHKEQEMSPRQKAVLLSQFREKAQSFGSMINSGLEPPISSSSNENLAYYKNENQQNHLKNENNSLSKQLMFPTIPPIQSSLIIRQDKLKLSDENIPMPQTPGQVNFALNGPMESIWDNELIQKKTTQLKGSNNGIITNRHANSMQILKTMDIQTFNWYFDSVKNYTQYFPESNMIKVIRKTHYVFIQNNKKKSNKKKEMIVKPFQKQQEFITQGKNKTQPNRNSLGSKIKDKKDTDKDKTNTPNTPLKSQFSKKSIN